MTTFSSLMAKQTILPIIQADSVSEGVKIAETMHRAGLGLVEVVLRTDASIDIVKAIKADVPGLKVGSGTITDEHILEQAVEAGSDFIITPAVSEKLLGHLAKCHLPVVPGVSNTGEILMAKEFGFKEMKLFPASLAGGAPFLKAMGSVFQDIKFCPTGGITQTNKSDFLSLNNVFAVGGTWVSRNDWVKNEDWEAIFHACQLAQH